MPLFPDRRIYTETKVLEDHQKKLRKLLEENLELKKTDIEKINEFMTFANTIFQKINNNLEWGISEDKNDFFDELTVKFKELVESLLGKTALPVIHKYQEWEEGYKDILRNNIIQAHLHNRSNIPRPASNRMFDYVDDRLNYAVNYFATYFEEMYNPGVDPEYIKEKKAIFYGFMKMWWSEFLTENGELRKVVDIYEVNQKFLQNVHPIFFIKHANGAYVLDIHLEPETFNLFMSKLYELLGSFYAETYYKHYPKKS